MKTKQEQELEKKDRLIANLEAQVRLLNVKNENQTSIIKSYIGDFESLRSQLNATQRMYVITQRLLRIIKATINGIVFEGEDCPIPTQPELQRSKQEGNHHILSSAWVKDA